MAAAHEIPPSLNFKLLGKTIEKAEVVFYHDPCSDGRTARRILEHVFPNEQRKFIGCPNPGASIYKYKNEIEGQHVLFLDCSPQKTDAHILASTTASVMVVDHHYPVLKEKREWLWDFALVWYEEGYATCDFLWRHLCIKHPMPTVIHAIGQRDVWGKDYTSDEKTKALAIYFYSNPDKNPVDYTDPAICAIVTCVALLHYRELMEKMSCYLDKHQTVYDVATDKKLAVVVASRQDFPVSEFANEFVARVSAGTSNTVAVVASIEYDHESGEIGLKLSLRSNQTVKVQPIAKKLGGNGHDYAAGATIDLPVNFDYRSPNATKAIEDYIHDRVASAWRGDEQAME